MSPLNNLNILTYFHDRSVYNILSYALKDKGIMLSNYDDSIDLDNSRFHLTILDGDLESAKISDFLSLCSKKLSNARILLAINDNYSYFLTQKLPFAIKGIIYKPLMVDELSFIIENSFESF